MSNFVNYGWAGIDRKVLDKALANAPPRLIQRINILGSGPNIDNLMLFRITRKVLGKDTDNYAQQIGDCCSFGGKNATEYLACCQIALGNLSEFHPIFPPYSYGTGRKIGNMLGQEDGSTGIFTAQAANQYGELNSDAEGVPKYSGDIATRWGNNESAWSSFVDTGKQHLVKSTAKISNWDDAVAAITNMYTITVASSVGFSMKPSSDGFHHREGSWGHQLTCIGIDNGDKAKGIPACAAILNSWADVMGGPLQDFRDPSLTWPVGMLRITKEDFLSMISEDDTWAYSSFEDFPIQNLPLEMFDMV